MARGSEVEPTITAYSAGHSHSGYSRWWLGRVNQRPRPPRANEWVWYWRRDKNEFFRHPTKLSDLLCASRAAKNFNFRFLCVCVGGGGGRPMYDLVRELQHVVFPKVLAGIFSTLFTVSFIIIYRCSPSIIISCYASQGRSCMTAATACQLPITTSQLPAEKATVTKPKKTVF